MDEKMGEIMASAIWNLMETADQYGVDREAYLHKAASFFFNIVSDARFREEYLQQSPKDDFCKIISFPGYTVDEER